MVDVVAGCAWREGLVLLGKRKATGKRGALWEMPGGKVDPGEDHPTALAREWKEELGIDVAVTSRCFAKATLDLEISFTVHLYEVEFPPTIHPACIDHDELGWYSLRHAVEYMPCSPAMYTHYPQVRQYVLDRYRRTL